MTFTTTVRSANLHFLLTGIPDGSNVDLYLSDDSGVIASSTNAENADELITWSPGAGEYRLGEGKDYTIWVLGEDVPDGPIIPNLKVWSDEVNIWLSTTSPDVVVNAIDPNESVDVIVNYAMDNWLPRKQSEHVSSLVHRLSRELSTNISRSRRVESCARCTCRSSRGIRHAHYLLGQCMFRTPGYSGGPVISCG